MSRNQVSHTMKCCWSWTHGYVASFLQYFLHMTYSLCAAFRFDTYGDRGTYARHACTHGNLVSWWCRRIFTTFCRLRRYRCKATRVHDIFRRSELPTTFQDNHQRDLPYCQVRITEGPFTNTTLVTYRAMPCSAESLQVLKELGCVSFQELIDKRVATSKWTVLYRWRVWLTRTHSETKFITGTRWFLSDLSDGLYYTILTIARASGSWGFSLL